MSDFLLLAFLFLIAGVVAVPIASVLGLGSVLGYLIAGIVLSPTLAFLEVDVVSIQHFAEFGVVMMLFLVGLELEPRRLWDLRSRLLGLGGLQVAGTTALVAGVLMAFRVDWRIALVIGLILAMSSTAIVLQTLAEKGLIRGDGGQAGFSVLLFQDIAVIPILALVPLLAIPGAHHADDAGHAAGMSLVEGLAGWQAALVTAGAIAVVIAGGMFLTRPLFRYIAKARLREIFVATALMFVVGIALLMSLVGLSPALGTFLAGVVLANSEYRHELESDIDPFRGLLLGLFFMAVGAAIDRHLLWQDLFPILGLTLAVMAGKALVLLVLARVFGLRGSEKFLFGLGLAQAGEFGFVLTSFAVSNAVLPDTMAPRLNLIITLSMMLTPGLFILYDRVIRPRFDRPADRADDEITDKGTAIIAGHGRFGGIVNRMLLAAGYKTVVLDHSAAQLDMLRTFGFTVYYGDATRPDLLHSAGIAEAKLLVVAIDDPAQAVSIVHHVTQNHPHVHVIARARDRRHVYELYSAGCRDIIRETFDSSVRTGRSAYEALGMHPFEAERLARAFVKADRHALYELAQLWDPAIPDSQNEAYVKKAREMNEDLELGAALGAFRERNERGWTPPTPLDADADRGRIEEARALGEG
ncbi:MAG: cation:proton antiporter [Rhodobacteraceae bacterium]|nr:cation:proton antiporter [Paracoccaceae bacterium]